MNPGIENKALFFYRYFRAFKTSVATPARERNFIKFMPESNFTMNSTKILGLLLITMFLFVTRVPAQPVSDKEYHQLIKLIDQYSLYNMNQYDSLYHIETSDTIGGRTYSGDYWGWVISDSDSALIFLDIDGTRCNIAPQTIIATYYQPPGNTMPDSLLKKKELLKFYDRGRFGRNYLLISWLDKKGEPGLAKTLLGKGKEHIFRPEMVQSDFCTLYYTAMLNMFTTERDYEKAITYGNHLSKDVFKGYLYYQDIIALTQQLKTRKEDFKTFCLPRSPEWDSLKLKLARSQQIKYLADRLRLINCIQPGQPAGISYTMFQYAVPMAQSRELKFSYWEYSAQYNVINPYNELVNMKLSPLELQQLLPYLLEDTYIPAYTYFRDFMQDRTLHKLSRVINDLLFDIAKKHFLDLEAFDRMTPKQKEVAVADIKKWCIANDTLPAAERTKMIMMTTNEWAEFEKSLKDARDNKYDYILPVIEKRFNSFTERFLWPTSNGVMAQTMFELGDTSNIKTVMIWNRDSTDNWVLLWSSLFLMKYDKENHNNALGKLEKLLKTCDGVSYYPHALEMLLTINSERTRKMAEGIMDKERFQSMIYWGNNLNAVKMLLQARNDYTFNFLDKQLKHCLEDEEYVRDKPDNQLFFTQCDAYITAVDALRSQAITYDLRWDKAKRVKYIEDLVFWFGQNYRLYKEGKLHKLDLNIIAAQGL